MWNLRIGDRRCWSAVIAAALGLSAATASAQSWERGYAAADGTLPSAQGWTLITTDTAPDDGLDEGNYLVAAGALMHGDTGGINADLGNRQSYELAIPDVDFDDEVLELEFRLQVLNSSGTAPDDVPFNVRPDAGFDVRVSDGNENSVQLGFASDFVMFRKQIVGNEPFVDFDTTDGFHTYVLRIERDRSVLLIDDVERVEQDAAIRVPTPGAANVLIFGDQSSFESSSTQLESITIRRSEIPDASVRNYSTVSQTFVSGSQSSLEGTVSCPAGSYALGGGVEPIGANGSLAVVWSRPAAGPLATTWEGKAREIVPTGVDWTMRVDVICGEVSGFTRYDETLLPSTNAAEKFLNLECGENEIMIGGGTNIVGPAQNIALHASKLGEVGATRSMRSEAADFGAGATSTQAWTLESHAFCSDAVGFEIVEVSSPMDAAPDKTVTVNCPSGKVPISGGGLIVGGDTTAALEVSRPKDGAPGEYPVGWIAEAQNTAPLWWMTASVVCAPISDPTVSKAGMVARYQGEDAGFDSWAPLHGTPVGGVDYAPGAMGAAFEFDGSLGQSIELPPAIGGTEYNLYFKDSFTLDAWVQSDGVTRGESNYIATYYEWGGVTNALGTNPGHYAIMLDADGYARGFVRSSVAGDIYASVVGDVPLDDGTPHHVLMVRDDDERELRLYVDGREVDAIPLTNSTLGPFIPGYPPLPDPILIGGSPQVDSTVADKNFEGLIDDVKFYDRALTPAEIEAIAGCGLPVLPRVINLDARRYGSPSSENHRLCVNLDGGDYVVTVVSPDQEPEAVHHAWSDSATGGWGTEFHIDPEVDSALSFGQAPAYTTGAEAFDGLATKAFILSVSANQQVDFSIQDVLNLDNRGGVSLKLEEYVPEPGFGLCLLAGCGLLVAMKSRSPRVRARLPALESAKAD